MKALQMLTRWTRTPNALRVTAFVVLALLFVGVFNFGTAVPVVNAAGTITVSRTDDPTPIPSACSGMFIDCSLRGAIIYADANPGTEIALAHGATYTLSIPASGSDDATTGNLNITADTTIDFGGVICTINCPATIQGGAGWNDNVFQIDSGVNAQISGVTIQNGNTSSSGGGIANHGNLTLNSVKVMNNTATLGDGGGVFNSGSLTITNSTIISNTTSNTKSGGGLSNFPTGTVTISGSSIAYNTAGDGGGIHDNGGTLTLTNTTVTTNTTTSASGGGGGISAAGSLTMTGGSINANTTASGQPGGGLSYTGSGTVTINGADIYGNQTNNDLGGGIFCYGTMVLTNVTVNNNHGADGIYFYGGALTITGGTVNSNTGRGIDVQSGANLTMSGTTVNGNTALSYGGGLYLATTSSTISSSTIANNSSTFDGGEGGGIYLQSGALTVNTSTISGNNLTGLTSKGGGIYSESSSGLTVNASTISGNNAHGDGGISVAGPMAITNSTISDNTADSSTGGINVSSGVTSLSNVTITDNRSQSIPGGVWVGGTVNLKNSLIAGNTVTGQVSDCHGTLTSQGYNLLGTNGSCNGLTNGVNGDLVGTNSQPLNPSLAALANNGGPTLTHALLVGSLAINAGNPGASDGVGNHCAAADQRGIARPQYTRCDIGAYEYNGPASPMPQITGLNPDTIHRNCSGNGMWLTVNGSNFLSNSVVRFNGGDRPTTYVNAGQLTAQIGYSNLDICTLGTASITVFNGAPGGGISNSATFTILPDLYLFLPLITK